MRAGPADSRRTGSTSPTTATRSRRWSRASVRDDAARIVVRGERLDREQETFLKEYLAEVQEAGGISDQEVAAGLDPEVRERGVLNWGWVQGILGELDRKLPWASGASVALFTNDVYQYLHKPGLRKVMDDGVLSAFRPGVETVVVAHSLGTIVAYNVLKREGSERDLKVPLFMTLGSAARGQRRQEGSASDRASEVRRPLVQCHGRTRRGRAVPAYRRITSISSRRSRTRSTSTIRRRTGMASPATLATRRLLGASMKRCHRIGGCRACSSFPST